jgi:ribosome modulation factor
MSAIFDGSSSYLSLASAVATGTPAAFSGWFKSTDLTVRQVIVCISRLAAGGSPTAFLLDACGDLTAPTNTPVTDPLRCIMRQNSDTAGRAWSAQAYQTGVWHHGFCTFNSATERHVWLDGTAENSYENTSRSLVSLGGTSIGAFVERASILNYFAGRIAEVGIWTGAGVEAMGATEAAALFNKTKHVLDYSTGRVLYKRLKGEEAGPLDEGGTFTNNNSVGFDATDHPVSYGVPRHAMHYRRMRVA